MWAQLRADLQRRLAAGAFTNAFPGELALVSEYGVSRHTVQLRADGIVVAERGRRPRPAGPATITQPLGALYSLFASVESAGLRQASIVTGPATFAPTAPSPTGSVWRRPPPGTAPPGTREPLALDTVWLPAEIAAPLLEADFTHTALYDELAARTGIRLEGGREHIRAVVPTRAQQRLLAIPHSTGVLAIDRLGYAGGRPVEWRHTLIRGDRFSLIAEFSPRTGYQLTLGARPVTSAVASFPAAVS